MINLVYLYPQYNFLGNEVNICRIIDDEIKETLVIYGINKKDNIEIYITNTYTGETKLVKKINLINEIDLFIDSLIKEEINIKSENDLFSVEKYILKNM